jgi:3-deoxy-D-manno-octulosonate 8-phosphate phosphatase (KDO 8-P phosphatase)
VEKPVPGSRHEYRVFCLEFHPGSVKRLNFGFIPLFSSPSMKLHDAPSAFSRITTIMMDIDGVLTDGYVLAMADGEMLRRMHARDSFAIQYAVKAGYRLAVISGGYSRGMAHRLSNLGLEDVFMSVPLKLPKYEAYVTENGLSDAEVMYVGDDLPDLEVMKRAGLAAAPNDAATDIRDMADFVTRAPGGCGAVREVIEKVMKAQDKWYTTEALEW